MSFLSKLFGKSSVEIKVTKNVQSTVLPPGTDVDKAVMEQLRKSGIDLSAPFHVHQIFIMPTKESADRLGEELKSRGLSPEILDEHGHWKVVATEELVLDESALKTKRGEYASLGSNFGGGYIGWEVKTTKKFSTKVGP